MKIFYICLVIFSATAFAGGSLLPDKKCNFLLGSRTLISENPISDAWIFNSSSTAIPHPDETFKVWHELVENYSRKNLPEAVGKKYAADIVLGPSIRNGTRPAWIGENLFLQIEDITKLFLSVVSESLPNEGRFYIKDATVRVEQKGVPLYSASWHIDPGYIRVIFVLSGPGTMAWPRNALFPIQIENGQILVFSGNDRESVITGVKALMHSSPVDNLAIHVQPWTVSAGNFMSKEDSKVVKNRVLLVLDIDLEGHNLQMMPREDTVFIRKY